MNIAIVLVCAKYSKLITSEKIFNKRLAAPLCLPFFFVFSSEVLKSGIKSCFSGVVFQDAVIILYFCAVFLLYREFSERISLCFTAAKITKVSQETTNFFRVDFLFVFQALKVPLETLKIFTLGVTKFQFLKYKKFF